MKGIETNNLGKEIEKLRRKIDRLHSTDIEKRRVNKFTNQLSKVETYLEEGEDKKAEKKFDELNEIIKKIRTVIPCPECEEKIPEFKDKCENCDYIIGTPKEDKSKLFSISGYIKEIVYDLNDEDLHKSFREEYEKRGYDLSEGRDISITVEIEDEEWELFDENRGYKHEIREENGDLNIYEKPTFTINDLEKKLTEVIEEVMVADNPKQFLEEEINCAEDEKKKYWPDKRTEYNLQILIKLLKLFAEHLDEIRNQKSIFNIQFDENFHYKNLRDLMIFENGKLKIDYTYNNESMSMDIHFKRDLLSLTPPSRIPFKILLGPKIDFDAKPKDIKKKLSEIDDREHIEGIDLSKKSVNQLGNFTKAVKLFRDDIIDKFKVNPGNFFSGETNKKPSPLDKYNILKEKMEFYRKDKLNMDLSKSWALIIIPVLALSSLIYMISPTSPIEFLGTSSLFSFYYISYFLFLMVWFFIFMFMESFPHKEEISWLSQYKGEMFTYQLLIMSISLLIFFFLGYNFIEDIPLSEKMFGSLLGYIVVIVGFSRVGRSEVSEYFISKALLSLFVVLPILKWQLNNFQIGIEYEGQILFTAALFSGLIGCCYMRLTKDNPEDYITFLRYWAESVSDMANEIQDHPYMKDPEEPQQDKITLKVPPILIKSFIKKNKKFEVDEERNDYCLETDAFPTEIGKEKLNIQTKLRMNKFGIKKRIKSLLVMIFKTLFQKEIESEIRVMVRKQESDEDLQGEKGGSEKDHLFNLDFAEYKEYLEEGPISLELKKAFEYNGYDVEDDAKLSKEDRKWFVCKNDKKEYRIVADEEEGLKIYKEYDLEIDWDSFNDQKNIYYSDLNNKNVAIDYYRRCKNEKRLSTIKEWPSKDEVTDSADKDITNFKNICEWIKNEDPNPTGEDSLRDLVLDVFDTIRKGADLGLYIEKKDEDCFSIVLKFIKTRQMIKMSPLLYAVLLTDKKLHFENIDLFEKYIEKAFPDKVDIEEGYVTIAS